MNTNGMLGMMSAVTLLSGGRKYWMSAAGDPHREPDQDRDRETAEPGRDHRRERAGDEQRELAARRAR